MLRGVALMVGLLAAVPAVAGEMTAEEARRFVIGKLFNYECFEGTRGQGRIYPDGSVVGSIQLQGSGPVRYAHLPANTIRVKGESVCASLRGLPISPCFSLQKTGETSFRGAISGLGFASCSFTRHTIRAEAGEEAKPVQVVRRVNTSATGNATTNGSASASANAAPSHPLGLRPSLAAESE
jgi:hypothetical protein